MKLKVFLLFAASIFCMAYNTRAVAANHFDLFSDQTAGIGQNYQDRNHVTRSSTVQVNPAFIEALAGIETNLDHSSLRLTMTPFFESPMVIIFKRWERVSSTGIALIGTIQGIPDSEAIFVTNGSTLTANISLPGKRFHIRPRENGSHELQDIDVNSYPEHLNPIPISLPPGPFTLDPPRSFDGNQIDVLVAYTSDARAAAEGTSAIEAQIDLAVVETNQGYTNSGVTQRIRLVHKVETSYSEAGFNWGDTLDRLQGTSDGYMDNVHVLRDMYQADLVVLIVNNEDNCGIGYLMQSVSPSFAAYSFCVVSRRCATGYYSFAHEMGHNMGAHHDRVTGGTGAYEYSHGYQEPGKTFRTIMAYNCAGGCPRINHWSNPDVIFDGKPTGVLYTDPSSADNRRTLNNTVATVANFRTSGSSLSVQTAGNGTGTVTSNPPGIDCGSTCSSTFVEGSTVTLTASADSGSVFDGWDGGGCSGTGLCVVTVSGSIVVTATFTHQDIPPEPSVLEGTIGTLITITGSGFGQKKGKVLINGVATKIAKDSWGDSLIYCTLTKALPPGVPYVMTIMVQPYKTAHPITLTDTFTVRNPELDELTAQNNHGAAGTSITLDGRFFGTKKGKVYLENTSSGKKKSCKVTYWYMNPQDGTSNLTFTVPGGLISGAPYTLKVSNKMGTVTASTDFIVGP